MKLVLLRHGESIWNKENKFTGWTDVELTENGKNEAHKAGLLLKEKGYTFDVAFTSVLKRANDTLDIVLKEMNLNIPVHYSYKLNERHYGALQGLNKDETRKKYGEEQVHLWRRSATVRPPALDINDVRYPGNDIKYKDLDKKDLPLTECLLDTMKRTVEYYESDIKEELLQDKNVLIVAHGNSLRSIIKYLENISDEDIMNIELPTGVPFVYEMNKNLEIVNKFFLK
mgnify:CR=1 FL=1